MAKCIRDGKSAILYSPGYGSGWSTWDSGENYEFLVHDEKLVELVESDQRSKIEDYIESIHPSIYCGDAKNLAVEWVPVGTRYRIEEYDGWESIEFDHSSYWHNA